MGCANTSAGAWRGGQDQLVPRAGGHTRRRPARRRHFAVANQYSAEMHDLGRRTVYLWLIGWGNKPEFSAINTGNRAWGARTPRGAIDLRAVMPSA